MAQDWFELSLKDGSLKLTKEPSRSKPVRWLERDLENLMAMNPTFLGVEDDLPLRLGATRGTVTAPDQAYVDELGRVTLVEVKKVRASSSVISQVIAYADHWRMLPPGEVDRGLRKLADVDQRREIFGRALLEAQIWGKQRAARMEDEKELRRLGKIVLSRLKTKWEGIGLPSLTNFAAHRWNSDRLPLVGAPARLVAVAPRFSDECYDIAEQLSQRMVGVELVEVEIVRSDDRFFVGREYVHRDPVAEPTWRLLRHAWDSAELRDHFLVNGWADHLSRESFSLSARAATNVRLWLWSSDSDASVTAVVPDGWFKNDAVRRRELRKRFLKALPNSPWRNPDSP